MMPVDEGDRRFDERFIARLKRRDEQAFNQFVVAYEARVFRLAWRMLGSKTEAKPWKNTCTKPIGPLKKESFRKTNSA